MLPQHAEDREQVDARDGPRDEPHHCRQRPRDPERHASPRRRRDPPANAEDHRQEAQHRDPIAPIVPPSRARSRGMPNSPP